MFWGSERIGVFPSRTISQQLLACPTEHRPGPPTLRGGVKDRARPAARVLDPTPLPGRVLRCAAMAKSHTHPHAHRRLWLQGSSTWLLLSLSEACCSKSLPRLGELVEEVLYQRWRDLPPVQMDPVLEVLLPY